MRELRSKYAWADADYDLAWTVAIIRGQTADAVLALYGGGPAGKLGELTFNEADAYRNEHFDQYSVLQLLARDQLVVAIEPNGWMGNGPEIARRVSAGGGDFFSVYWSPVAFQIVQARDGQIIASFDPNFIGLPAGANDLLPGWVGDDDFPLDQLKSSCLAAVEQQTGMAFDRGWLGEPLPTYRLPNPDELLKDVSPGSG
jgi:hypothetical protein